MRNIQRRGFNRIHPIMHRQALKCKWLSELHFAPPLRSELPSEYYYDNLLCYMEGNFMKSKVVNTQTIVCKPKTRAENICIYIDRKRNL